MRLRTRILLALSIGVPLLVVTLAFLAWHNYDKPLPGPKLVQLINQGETDEKPPTVRLPWPSIGGAAIAIGGLGQVDSVRDETAYPIASLVKVMTAYVVLQDHPLKPAEPGPMVTLDDDDVRAYNAGRSNAESVVAVRAGLQISERNLLEGLLIPSANNYAYSLAKWDAGSQEAFVDRMNEAAAKLEMKDTHYADASGVGPESHSTAHDQLLLAQAAMANQTFALLVQQKQAALPIAGVVFNVNSMLGQNGIIGLKTGWTEEAGACFLFVADSKADGQPIRVFGAVTRQDTLADAFRATQALIAAAVPNVHVLRVAADGSPAVTLRSKWGTEANATLAKDIQVLTWPNVKVDLSSEITATNNEWKKGDEIGQLALSAGSQKVVAPLIAAGSLPGPSMTWRILRR